MTEQQLNIVEGLRKMFKKDASLSFFRAVTMIKAHCPPDVNNTDVVTALRVLGALPPTRK